MIYDLFVLGGMAFYALTAVAVLLFFWATEHDRHYGGTVAAVLVFLLAWLLLGDLGPRIVAHPYWLAWAVPGWLAVGLAWSFPRWLLLLNRSLREYQRAKAEHLAQTEVRIPYTDEWRPPTLETWQKSAEFGYLKTEYGLDVADGKLVPPSFAYNRGRMVNWVLLWPCSLLWTFARDVFYEAVDFCVNLCGKVYQRLAAWMYRGVE